MWPWRDRSIVIEALKAESAPEVGVLHAENFARAWGAAEIEALIADPACLGHAARAQGWPSRIDGFILSRIAGDEAEILSVAVRRARQGQGIAGRLLLHHLGALGPRQVRSLFLEVDEANAPALALYRRHGFAKVGERKSYYRRMDGSAANALVMRRDLG